MKKEIDNLKLALLSGASHALKYKQDFTRASDDEIIQMISNEMEEILLKIHRDF